MKTDCQFDPQRPIYAYILDVVHGLASTDDLFRVVQALPVERARRLIREAVQYGVISRMRAVCWQAVKRSES